MLLDFSKDFTNKDATLINLNNGTLGLCPDVVINQQLLETKKFESNTSLSLESSWRRLWEVQQQLAAFLGGSAKDLFFRPNVTLAINEIIMGLKLQPHAEILTTTSEYGAVINILKYKADKEDLALRFIDIDFLLKKTPEEDFVNYVVGSLNQRTRVFVVSHIFTGNGYVVPLMSLAKALREKGVLLVVDGAHGPGLIDINLNEFENVDYYAGNLHKWFMGAKGTAFGWVHPIHQDKTFPLYGSWTTANNTPQAMEIFKEQSPFCERMLWSHSQSFMPFYALSTGFEFWNSYGKDLILNEISKRMRFLEEGLEDLGFHPLKSTQSPHGAAFLCYATEGIPGLDFDGLFLKSSAPKIQVGRPRVSGKNVIRLTPHIHNTQEELELTLKFFARLRWDLSK